MYSLTCIYVTVYGLGNCSEHVGVMRLSSALPPQTQIMRPEGTVFHLRDHLAGLAD